MVPDIASIDDRQQRIYAALAERRSDIASMYRAALLLLTTPAEVGDERTRISHICHSVREVMNRVLGAMGTTASPRIKPPTGKQVQELPDMLARFPGLALDADGESIPVPRAVAEIFDKLIKTAVQEKRRSRDDVASLLTDDGNSEHLVVKRWVESRDFFVRWAHLQDDEPKLSDLPSDDLLRDHVAVFDELFDTVITAFFTLRHSIDDLLAEINALEEVGNDNAWYKKPSKADVQAVLLKIPTLQLRRVFYEGLNNPHWVRPLFEAHAFANPPEPENTDDGYVRDVYWPEIAYLARVAPEVPTDVVDVLRALTNSNNTWVRRAVFEIGSRIPAAEGARLKALLQAWAATRQGFGWRTDPSELVSFAITLLDGGENKAGRWLANNLFAPRPSVSDGPFRRTPVLAMDDYWYQEELPRLVPALGADALKAVAGWLASFEKLSGHDGDEHDFSGMIRPSIRARDSSYPSPEHALVDAVRDLAIPAVLKDPEETVKALLRSRVQLLRKIAMFAVAEAIRQRIDTGADARYLLGVAERLLGDEASDDDNLRVEYAELGQSVAKIDSAALNVINNFIAYAHAEDLKWMRERFVDPETPAEEAEAQVQERADRNKHRWLSALGADALPPGLRTELAELDARNGMVEGARTPSGMVTGWTGPNPYCTQDEMATMSPTELVAHLASWHDTGDGWGPEPSHEGQGRELAGLLTTNPRAIAGVTGLIEKLRPTYLRAILRGWEAALKADMELDWSEVAALIRDVLEHGNESPFPVEGGTMDDDKDFRGAKNAAVGLLEEIVKERDSVSISDQSMVQFAKLLIEDAKDDEAWAEYNAYEVGENSWDPLTMSLNWQWPNRLRALIYLATRAKQAPWKPAAMAAIERELARDDRHGAGRAVLGEKTGRILTHSSEWLKGHLEAFFGSEHNLSVQQQIGLTTALTTHYYHRDLYDLLNGPMIAAIDLGDALICGWRTRSSPIQRIGEWAVDSLIYGHKTADDPVVHAFFATVDAKIRGDALGAIASSFYHASHVDEEIRDRFGDLWDERFQHVRDHPEDHEELKGFYWIAKGNKFPVQWWLPRLRDALELEPAIATERYMIGKNLAQASTVDPATAFAVLKLLLDGRDEGGMASYDPTRNAVPMVIANAMTSGDDSLGSAAEAFMNSLGAKGHLRLEAEVKAVLGGAATIADVAE
ncbi:hypothetical protein MED01_005088 [Micromonospora sp. MED01]|uniref:hypothetical protein n=1 Tax=Micromonospora alfalfae TaxID=2911212 RepID=UPI001EE89716|nr:hypothetical protein [Micromonospora alfalfae]MCG5466271.1 hypothetical protein [Micromonospora alfalfae]